MTTKDWSRGTVLISGAGLIGLLTAHALKKLGIPFQIFDRDESIISRGQGWGITLHWALSDFLFLLPEDVQKEVYKCQVLEDFHTKDNGQFLYINAGTGEPVLKIPPSKRLRVRREQLRRILVKDINVQWGCRTSSIAFDESNSNPNKRVKVICDNGKSFEGGLLIGAEGANSISRRICSPGEGELYDLPVRFLGTTIQLTEEEYKDISEKFDPLLFQGTIPLNGSFFWFSLLSSPKYNKTSFYEAQVNFSWKVEDKSAEAFTTTENKIQVIEEKSKGLNEKLMFLKEKMIERHKQFMEIRLSDWPQVDWNDHEGTAILVGDAAHAMVMYRGEAANHGIADIKLLYDLFNDSIMEELDWNECIATYKTKMKARAAPAVLLSRDACMDAHEWSKINLESESPLLTKRKK